MKLKNFLIFCALLTFFVLFSAGRDCIQQKELTVDETKIMVNTSKLTAMFSEGRIDDMVTQLYNKDAVIFLPREDWLKQKGAPKETLEFWAHLMKKFPTGEVRGHDMIKQFWNAFKEMGAKDVVFNIVNLSIANEAANQTFRYSFIVQKAARVPEDPEGEGGAIWRHRYDCQWELVTQYF